MSFPAVRERPAECVVGAPPGSGDVCCRSEPDCYPELESPETGEIATPEWAAAGEDSVLRGVSWVRFFALCTALMEAPVKYPDFPPEPMGGGQSAGKPGMDDPHPSPSTVPGAYIRWMQIPE